MNVAEVGHLSEQELRVKKKILGRELFEARMKNSLGQLASPMSIRHLRRDIARIETVLSSKKLELRK